MAGPVLMTPVQLEAFIENAEPGDRATYYVGNLAIDRVESPYADAISRTADYAADHSIGERFLMSPCNHARTVVIGSGELSLAQQKMHDGVYTYFAVKR